MLQHFILIKYCQNVIRIKTLSVYQFNNKRITISSAEMLMYTIDIMLKRINNNKQSLTDELS